MVKYVAKKYEEIDDVGILRPSISKYHHVSWMVREATWISTSGCLDFNPSIEGCSSGSARLILCSLGVGDAFGSEFGAGLAKA